MGQGGGRSARERSRWRVGRDWQGRSSDFRAGSRRLDGRNGPKLGDQVQRTGNSPKRQLARFGGNAEATEETEERTPGQDSASKAVGSAAPEARQASNPRCQLSDGSFAGVQAHGAGATRDAVLNYLYEEFGMNGQGEPFFFGIGAEGATGPCRPGSKTAISAGTCRLSSGDQWRAVRGVTGCIRRQRSESRPGISRAQKRLPARGARRVVLHAPWAVVLQGGGVHI